MLRSLSRGRTLCLANASPRMVRTLLRALEGAKTLKTYGMASISEQIPKTPKTITPGATEVAPMAQPSAQTDTPSTEMATKTEPRQSDPTPGCSSGGEQALLHAVSTLRNLRLEMTQKRDRSTYKAKRQARKAAKIAAGTWLAENPHKKRKERLEQNSGSVQTPSSSAQARDSGKRPRSESSTPSSSTMKPQPKRQRL